MGKQVTYTSKMSITLMTELDKYSDKFKTSKRNIIEKALRQLFHEIKRKEYADAFKKLSKDKEYLELAEIGLDDYVKHLG